MRLRVTSGSGPARFVEVGPGSIVGRAPDATVILDDPQVSGHHARLRPVEGGIEVTDLGSRNGTFIGGEPVAGSALLRPGQELRIGSARLVIDVPAAAEPDAGVTRIVSAASPGARLVVRTGVDSGRQLTLLPGQQYTIGRDPGSGLVLTDSRVSGRHARIQLVAGGLIVYDLGSANGTLVNKQRVQGQAPAAEGTEIQVGETVLLFTTRGDEAWRSLPAPTIVGLASDASVAAAVRQQTRKGRRGLLAGIAAAAFVAAAGGAAAAILLREDEDPPAAPTAVAGASTQAPLTEAEIIANNTPATVRVDLYDARGAFLGHGSGAVIDAAAGLVLTNAHVAGVGRAEVVNDSTGKSLASTLVAIAPCDDLALLKIDDLSAAATLRSVQFGDAATLKVGERVIALGYPASAESSSGAQRDSLSATSGIISKTHTVYTTSDGSLPDLPDMIQHQASINPGNSGGPLFDSLGRFVGINTRLFFIPGRERAEGENYAISLERINALLPGLKAGRSSRWFGASVAQLRDTDEKLAGVGVQTVFADSEAARAGLAGLTPANQAVQAITAVDGKPLATVRDLCQLLPADGTVTLTVKELGRSRTFEATIRVGSVR